MSQRRKGVVTEAEIKALARIFFSDDGPETASEEDMKLARSAMENMSDWQSMSSEELNQLIEDEERARGSRN